MPEQHFVRGYVREELCLGYYVQKSFCLFPVCSENSVKIHFDVDPNYHKNLIMFRLDKI